MADTFYTLSAESTALVREKMSRFISFAIPVGSADEAKSRIAAIANKYHDARHVCWAYMIGSARTEYLSSDNGEPSGTAGKPILGQINSFNLTNIVIVVVRYFGGIKLGTSGLIGAYREAAREAIEAGTIIECHDIATVTFSFPYLSMNDVMRVAKDPGVKVVEQEFDNSCSMTLSTRVDHMEVLLRRLESIDGVTVR